MGPEQVALGPAVPATWCGELELGGDAPVQSVLPHTGQRRARLLIRLHGDPVGYVELSTGGGRPDATEVARLAADRYVDRITAHLAAEGASWTPG